MTVLQGTFYTELLNSKTQCYKNVSVQLMYQFNVILTKIQDFFQGRACPEMILNSNEELNNEPGKP